MAGWPTTKKEVPPSITPYFDYRDELTVQGGIILRGERVVIPCSLRLDIKNKLHAGHFGINSCLRRARELVFWPGMSSDIRQTIERCSTCAMYCDRQAAEPLVMNEVPERPYATVACDLFTIQGRDYLVTVDCYSTFIEVDNLTSTTSKAVIAKLKQHFARHGIPDVVISDNGPQFSSEDFRTFATKWNFTHQTSSPGNSQSNGAAEAAVKTIKRMMRKCAEAKEDPYLGLLNLRNTPTEGLSTSPSQRLMGRRTKTLVPTTSHVLIPKQPIYEQMSIEAKRAKAAERHITRRTLSVLHPGDNVRVQPTQPGQLTWKQATVTRHLGGKSYEVATDDGSTLRRNRRLLRAKPGSSDYRSTLETTSETTPVKPPELTAADNCAPETTKAAIQSQTDTMPYSTRSGRRIKVPTRFQD